jgi:hypothetical protein
MKRSTQEIVYQYDQKILGIKKSFSPITETDSFDESEIPSFESRVEMMALDMLLIVFSMNRLDDGYSPSEFKQFLESPTGETLLKKAKEAISSHLPLTINKILLSK